MFASVLIVSNTIGAIPLFIVYAGRAASNPEIIGKIAANPSDLSALGVGPSAGLLLMLIPFLAGLCTFILLIKPLNNRSLKSVINGRETIRWRRFFISALVWIILSAVYLFICIKLDPSNFTINNCSYTLIFLILISVLFIPFQAIFEEVLFRGYLLQGFGVLSGNRWFPLIMTSVLFGLMHSFNPEVKDFGFITMMPQYLLFGLLFGTVTILDDGIEVSMGAHTGNNIFLCVMVTSKSSALQTPAIYEQHTIYPWTDFAGLVISSILFLIVLKVIFKWKDLPVIWRKIPVNKNIAQIP